MKLKILNTVHSVFAPDLKHPYPTASATASAFGKRHIHSSVRSAHPAAHLGRHSHRTGTGNSTRCPAGPRLPATHTRARLHCCTVQPAACKATKQQAPAPPPFKPTPPAHGAHRSHLHPTNSRGAGHSRHPHKPNPRAEHQSRTEFVAVVVGRRGQARRHGGVQGDADLGGPREAGVVDARGDAAAGVGGPVPDAPRPGGVDAHLPLGRGRGPRRDPRCAGQGAGLLLPAGGSHRGRGGGRAPRHPVHRRRRLLRGGRGGLQPGGRAVPGAAPPAAQGGPRPVPRRRPLVRRAAQHHHDDADHQVHLRRVRDGPAVQPRVGGRHGRGAVHQRRGGHGAGADGAQGAARVAPGEVPQPEHQAWPAPGAPRAGAGLRRARLPHALHRRPQEEVQGAQRQVLLGLRRAHGQALAVPHPRARAGPGHRGQALLLRQRPPPAQARQGLLRQLHLPREDVRAGREGARLLHPGGGRHDPGGQGQDGRRVLPLRQGGDGPGPVPDDLQLRVHLCLRLEQARLLRRGLRLWPAHVRRPARQQ